MLKSKSKTKTQKMRDQAGEVIDRLAPHVETAREKAGSAREKAAPFVHEAREKAAPYVQEARDKAAPLVQEAREKASPVVESARAKFTTEVLPVITAAVAAASEATEEAREEALRRSHATAAALRGEIEAPRKKSHKRRNLLLLLGLSGIAALVAKRMSDRQATTAWQSSYTPSAPTSTGGASAPSYSAPGVAASGGPDVDDTPRGPAAAAAAAKARDEAASAPDEAAADATEHPHRATTPDNPAEEVRIDEDRA